jgi:hypothetical protein
VSVEEEASEARPMLEGLGVAEAEAEEVEGSAVAAAGRARF